MKARWLMLCSRYALLKPREKGLVALAVLLLVGLVGFSLLVDPARMRAAIAGKQLSQQQADLEMVRTQLQLLKSQQADPDAANRKALEERRTRLAAVDTQMERFSANLVPADQVGKLLHSVLARHRGLALVSLRTLAPQALLTVLESDTGAAGKNGDAAKSGSPERKADFAPADGENLYKHGLEIRVAGSYADLMAYVAELEKMPQRLLWERMSLSAAGYPRNELTLTVYTLSRDPDWLVL